MKSSHELSVFCFVFEWLFSANTSFHAAILFSADSAASLPWRWLLICCSLVSLSSADSVASISRYSVVALPGFSFFKQNAEIWLQRRREQMAGVSKLQQLSINQPERLATEPAEEREARLQQLSINPLERLLLSQLSHLLCRNVCLCLIVWAAWLALSMTANHSSLFRSRDSWLVWLCCRLWLVFNFGCHSPLLAWPRSYLWLFGLLSPSL